jgi:hypothetical protein
MNALRIGCVALLLVVGVSVGFGWGNATHVYFANHLGVKFGPLNQNEMYGAVLPDLYGYQFDNMGALAADYALHTSGDLYWGFYSLTVGREAKAAVYGMFTHSNAQTIKGADWYAHGVAPFPGGAPDPRGWVVQQGGILAQHPAILGYVNGLLEPYGSPELVQGFLPVVGHTLIETAVDILVRRCQDPFVGARLYLAAKNRTEETPQIMAAVIAQLPVENGNPPFPTVEYTLGLEAGYREAMMQYGQLFMLPENQLIGLLSAQTATLAHDYLAALLGSIGITQVPDVDAAKIAEFIQIAINQVRPIYRAELYATLCRVEKNMEKNGPPVAGPVFAFWGKETIEEEFEGMKLPAEAPGEFALDQNYPNPFNPATTIAFALPSDQVVTLKIYNTIGQEVATLVNEFKTAGRYSAVWDAKGLPSGVYFCRLQAGSIVDTKKMTLMK